MLLEILSEIITIPDVLLIVKNDGATSEVKSNLLKIKKNEKWITIGDNNDPAHLHIDSYKVSFAEFVKEEKPERTIFSVRFFDQHHKQVLGAFFTKMYDKNKNLNKDRLALYENLIQKYGSKVQLK